MTSPALPSAGQCLRALFESRHTCHSRPLISDPILRRDRQLEEKNVKAAREREASLLAAYRSPATDKVAAE